MQISAHPDRFNAGARSGVVLRGVVVHTTEGGENSGVANYLVAAGDRRTMGWTEQNPSMYGSSYDAIALGDGTWIDVANGVDGNGAPYAAPPLNTYWLHIVMPGKIAQDREEFLDDWSYGCIRAVAKYIVKHSQLWGFPPIRRDVRYLVGVGVENCTGYCGHGDVEGAWHKSGGHTDPGPNFPWDVLEQEITKLTAPVAVVEEDEVKVRFLWRDERYQNVFAELENGEVHVVTQGTLAAYSKNGDVQVLSVVEAHEQKLDSYLAKTGLARAAMVPA